MHRDASPRHRRGAAVPTILALLLLAVPAAPAGAAGTGGISLTPLPAVVDGEPVTSFRVEVPSEGSEQVAFALRNVTDEERSARLFAAPVTRDGDELRLGEPGSSPHVALEDRVVTLAPGEVLEESFTLTGPRPDGEQLAAVVLEVTNGSVTTQASTLVYLEPGRQVPLPLLLVALAVLLVALSAAAWTAHVRRRRA